METKSIIIFKKSKRTKQMEGISRGSPEYLELLRQAKLNEMILQQANNNKLNTLKRMLDIQVRIEDGFTLVVNSDIFINENSVQKETRSLIQFADSIVNPEHTDSIPLSLESAIGSDDFLGELDNFMGDTNIGYESIKNPMKGNLYAKMKINRMLFIKHYEAAAKQVIRAWRADYTCKKKLSQYTIEDHYKSDLMDRNIWGN